MGARDSMTVQVLNLSPRTTVAELNTFFSYCGTVRQIQLLSVGDQLPYALVTFGQPYAFQTALLLNAKSQGVIPEANMLGRSREVEAVGERQSAHGTNKISNLCCRAGMGTAIMNNNYISTGAASFSDVLDKASRSVSELGIRRKDKISFLILYMHRNRLNNTHHGEH